MINKVLNKRTDTIPPDAVYVGRPSKWGNPYKMNNDYCPAGLSMVGKRNLVIDMYRDYILDNPRLLKALPELKGKDLVCWCHTWDGQGDNPMYCHADVLLEMANK